MGGVPERLCSMPTGEIEMVKSKKYEQAFDFLDMILKSEEFLSVLKAWNLVTPEIWAGYTLHGIEGLAEQEILADQLEKLKLLWSKRQPKSFWGKHYESNADQEDSTGTGI